MAGRRSWPGGVRGAPAGSDASREIGSVVADESQQSRSAGVLPGQAEEVQAGYAGDAALVGYLTVPGHSRYLDPGVVGPVAGGPDHHTGVQCAAVGEVGGARAGAGEPGPEPDARRLKPAAAAADDKLPARHPPAQP